MVGRACFASLRRSAPRLGAEEKCCFGTGSFLCENKMLFTVKVVRLLSHGIFHHQWLILSFKHRRLAHFCELFFREERSLGKSV